MCTANSFVYSTLLLWEFDDLAKIKRLAVTEMTMRRMVDVLVVIEWKGGIIVYRKNLPIFASVPTTSVTETTIPSE